MCFIQRWGIPTTKFRSKFISSIKLKAQFCFKKEVQRIWAGPKFIPLLSSFSRTTLPRSRRPSCCAEPVFQIACTTTERALCTRGTLFREGGREGRRPLACNGFPRSVIVSLCGTGEFFLKKIKSPSISRREMVNNSKNP